MSERRMGRGGWEGEAQKAGGQQSRGWAAGDQPTAEPLPTERSRRVARRRTPRPDPRPGARVRAQGAPMEERLPRRGIKRNPVVETIGPWTTRGAREREAPASGPGRPHARTTRTLWPPRGSRPLPSDREHRHACVQQQGHTSSPPPRPPGVLGWQSATAARCACARRALPADGPSQQRRRHDRRRRRLGGCGGWDSTRERSLTTACVHRVPPTAHTRARPGHPVCTRRGKEHTGTKNRTKPDRPVHPPPPSSQ